MEVKDLKADLENERQKTRNIVGYYEEMIRAYEYKLNDEKLKNTMVTWNNFGIYSMLEDLDW